jgi:hypothetical protein
VGLVLGATGGARADGGDISVARLRIQAMPGTPCEPTTTSGLRRFCADNESWARLMSELGGSLIPAVLSPARTVGYGGFQLTAEGWVTGISGNSRYWQLGTEGDSAAGGEMCDGSTGLGCNRFAPNALVWSRLMARKGFPFGFQLGTGASYLFGTSLWAWSLEIQWSLFEGFREGFGGFFPDVAVRGSVNTVVGDPEFNLTVPSVDVVISKPIVVAGTMRVTPFVAWQIAFLFGDSELIDLTPDVDAFATCMPDPAVAGTVCRGSGDDYNNNTTFDQLRMTRQRLNLGLQLQYEVILLTGAFSFDLVEPSDADDDTPDGMSRMWTASFGAGVSFN